MRANSCSAFRVFVQIWLVVAGLFLWLISGNAIEVWRASQPETAVGYQSGKITKAEAHLKAPFEHVSITHESVAPKEFLISHEFMSFSICQAIWFELRTRVCETNRGFLYCGQKANTFRSYARTLRHIFIGREINIWRFRNLVANVIQGGGRWFLVALTKLEEMLRSKGSYCCKSYVMDAEGDETFVSVVHKMKLLLHDGQDARLGIHIGFDTSVCGVGGLFGCFSRSLGYLSLMFQVGQSAESNPNSATRYHDQSPVGPERITPYRQWAFWRLFLGFAFLLFGGYLRLRRRWNALSFVTFMLGWCLLLGPRLPQQHNRKEQQEQYAPEAHGR
jgi:hypothetical protein